MINSNYLYLVFSTFFILSFIYIFFNFKSNKSPITNKKLLKNLLESFDLELPEELKGLDNSPTDPQKFT